MPSFCSERALRGIKDFALQNFAAELDGGSSPTLGATAESSGVGLRDLLVLTTSMRS